MQHSQVTRHQLFTHLLSASLILFFGMALIACDQSPTGNSTSAGNAPSTVTSGTAGSAPVTVPSQVITEVKTLVAQGMHLSVAQITSQLQADPQEDLMGLAKPQGLAQDQLQHLILTSLQSASAQTVSAGTWTQQQADRDNTYWQQLSAPDLIATITAWFRMN